MAVCTTVVSQTTLTILAPSALDCPPTWSATTDPSRHTVLLHAAQRLRGAVYRADGMDIMLDDGRHVQAADARGWHVLSHEGDALRACLRLRVHARLFDPVGLDLWRPYWPASVAEALSRELGAAEGMVVEVGGWVVAPDARRSLHAFTVVATGLHLGIALGGRVGLLTATERHGSARMLTRLGGRVVRPAYDDPEYGCRMTLLAVDRTLKSRRPTRRPRVVCAGP